jgi:AcrR family transcriptional regulator
VGNVPPIGTKENVRVHYFWEHAVTPATRRRGDALEAAIFDAVFAQLEAVGYRKLTMEGVASAARTGKAALYRRWSSKDELITDALKHVLPEPPAQEPTGDVRADVLRLCRTFQRTIEACHGAPVRVLKEETAREDGKGLMHDVVQSRMTGPVKEALYRVLEDGAARGVVRPGAVTRQVANVGPAVIVYHNLTESSEVTDAFIVSLVDDVIMPMIRP